jgi:hypothetical protein
VRRPHVSCGCESSLMIDASFPLVSCVGNSYAVRCARPSEVVDAGRCEYRASLQYRGRRIATVAAGELPRISEARH